MLVSGRPTRYSITASGEFIGSPRHGPTRAWVHGSISTRPPHSLIPAFVLSFLSTVQILPTDLVDSVQTGQIASRTDPASPHAFPSATREAVCERRQIALYFAYREHR